ncbi:MAG: flagellar hook-associated protein FlgK [Armatimonadota bacterium]
MSFFGLDIAVSGLRAQQLAMNVTAQNITNAGAEGYHRQEAVTTAGTPLVGALTLANGSAAQLGTGTLIKTIRRLQSDFIDNQVRSENQLSGSWSYKQNALSQVESILAEPGDNGLATSFDAFWNSWNDLATSPESSSSKIATVEEGASLAQRINTLCGNLRDLQNQADSNVMTNANEINRLATEIAHLNEQIGKAAGDTTNQPCDLLDKRDVLLKELSHIINYQTNNTAGADLVISIGGKALVQGDMVSEVGITEGANGWSQLSWTDDGTTVSITGGEILGQIEARDDLIGGYINTLNNITSKLIDEVNKLYSSGTTPSGSPAGNFFIGSDASSIAVDANLVATPTNLTASYTGDSGSNKLAQDIAALANKGVMANGESIYGAYTSLVSQIGADSEEAQSRADLHALSLDELSTQTEAVSGVSLDEEMSNMVKFQQAYNATARIFTTIDEMMDTLVSMGKVGR